MCQLLCPIAELNNVINNNTYICNVGLAICIINQLLNDSYELMKHFQNILNKVQESMVKAQIISHAFNSVS